MSMYSSLPPRVLLLLPRATESTTTDKPRSRETFGGGKKRDGLSVGGAPGRESVLNGPPVRYLPLLALPDTERVRQDADLLVLPYRKAIGGDDPPVPVHVQNVVVTFSSGVSRLDLRQIATQCHLAYNPETFAALIARLKRPKTTILTFPSGNNVCAGAKSEQEARVACCEFTRMLQQAGIQCGFTNFFVQNLVASASVGFPLDLTWIAGNFSPMASYDPSAFPGLIFRTVATGGRQRGIVFLLFREGKLVITGGRSKQEVEQALTAFYARVILRARDPSAVLDYAQASEGIDSSLVLGDVNRQFEACSSSDEDRRQTGHQRGAFNDPERSGRMRLPPARVLRNEDVKPAWTARDRDAEVSESRPAIPSLAALRRPAPTRPVVTTTTTGAVLADNPPDVLGLSSQIDFSTALPLSLDDVVTPISMALPDVGDPCVDELQLVWTAFNKESEAFVRAGNESFAELLSSLSRLSGERSNDVGRDGYEGSCPPTPPPRDAIAARTKRRRVDGPMASNEAMVETKVGAELENNVGESDDASGMGMSIGGALAFAMAPDHDDLVEIVRNGGRYRELYARRRGRDTVVEAAGDSYSWVKQEMVGTGSFAQV